MGDLSINANDDASGAWPSGAASALRQESYGTRTFHAFKEGVFPRRRELPIYCNPIALFIGVWILMFAFLSFHVSYAIYPYFTTPILIFVVSIAALLLGYFASTAILQRTSPQTETVAYTLDVTALWRMNLLFCAGALALIGLNWIAAGPPPLIGDPGTYLEYGKLKQILFPLLTCIAVNATLDPSRLRRTLLIIFGLGALGLYVARGVMLITFLQMFFLFSLHSNRSRRKQYIMFAGAIAVGVAGMTIIGNLRTAHDVFIDFLQIRDQYSEWPMAFLWPASYISIPFSNLCWMLTHASSHGPTLSFLYSLLPSFMAPSDPYTDILGTTNIIDGASTYLQAWVLDFSYLGVYFANLIIGIGCGWLALRAFPRNALILTIFLTSISLLFFSDFFFLLSTVVQVFLQALVQRRCFVWPQTGIIHADSVA